MNNFFERLEKYPMPKKDHGNISKISATSNLEIKANEFIAGLNQVDSLACSWNINETNQWNAPENCSLAIFFSFRFCATTLLQYQDHIRFTFVIQQRPVRRELSFVSLPHRGEGTKRELHGAIRGAWWDSEGLLANGLCFSDSIWFRIRANSLTFTTV